MRKIFDIFTVVFAIIMEALAFNELVYIGANDFSIADLLMFSMLIVVSGTCCVMMDRVSRILKV